MLRLPKFITDILTDDTGINFTPDKVGLVSGFVGFHAYEFAHVVVNKMPFDAIAYGGGFGALMACGGGAMYMASRQKATPAAPDPNADLK